MASAYILTRGTVPPKATVALALHGSLRAAATEKQRPKQPKQPRLSGWGALLAKPDPFTPFSCAEFCTFNSSLVRRARRSARAWYCRVYSKVQL
jgi:hypothetical protein